MPAPLAAVIFASIFSEDAMTPETRQYPVVEAVFDRFARWSKHRREIVEFIPSPVPTPTH
jgi:hypothetical protein